MANRDDRIPVDIDYGFEDHHGDSQSITSGRTLATTATMYRHENGRTYHAFRDGEYFQPNDEKANNHEAIVHHLCLITLDDRLFLAPIEDPEYILDVGTGTGIWATDMADKFPNAEVIGTDLSPVQPGMQPSNCRFEIDDCASEWVYPDDHFDFIHMRGLYGALSDWPALYREVYKHLKPGGWFEQTEWSMHWWTPEDQPSPNPIHARWTKNMFQGAERMGKSLSIAEDMAGLLREAGFVDTVEKVFKWPCGPWSSDPKLKEIGRWNLLNWEEGAEGWIMAIFTRCLGYTKQEVHDFLREIRNSMRDRNAHVYHCIRIVYARKPPS